MPGAELLKPTPDDALRMWPVSRRVNKAGSGDDPSLVESVALHAAATTHAMAASPSSRSRRGAADAFQQTARLLP